MNNYNSKYHYRRSIRLPEYDYRQNGYYFITICTYQKQCWFCEIINQKMKLNQLGKIADKLWQGLAKRFDYINLDYYIVMPNHVHGIIEIKQNLAQNNDFQQRQFGKPVARSLSTIIGSYKSAVTKRINYLRHTKKQSIWQENYYEHIVKNIKNEQELNNIRQYIIENPMKWELDDNYINFHKEPQLELDLYF
ncbi:MAG: transposase [Moorea sp. SIO2B7]|nr:transposase [Moorena sp. SIO2B7]